MWRSGKSGVAVVNVGVALRKIRCRASKCRCGANEVNFVDVIRLIEVKEIDAYLQWRGRERERERERENEN